MRCINQKLGDVDQDMNKLFIICQNICPQTHGNVPGNIPAPYKEEKIKQNDLLESKQRSPSPYQDGENMTYSEKEAPMQLPEPTKWPKFVGLGSYDHIEIIDHIDGLFIDI
ncbi:hypothetical protein O181_079867 [Austropuccinia psidii MF-1]|uniref:Uncharacterized protein n=1 Tax=Austropuccinia psidii MF-1 TaxID=1389203 RepID=A0A9Q3FMW6_9BASI|nr:hypothetical protein [Austropuccinia psidii MF-1]